MEEPVNDRLFPAIFMAALSACSVASDDFSGSYVGGDGTAVLQLQIVEGDAGQINGSLAVTHWDREAEEMKLINRTVSGVRNDEQFSLVAHGNGWDSQETPLSLEANGSSLMLLIPGNGQSLEMQPMGQEEYREQLNEYAQSLTANDVGLLPDE
jgi:hypothetical protein